MDGDMKRSVDGDMKALDLTIESAWRIRRLDPEAARAVCTRTNADCESIGHVDGMAHSLLILGLVDAYSSDHQSAIEKMMKAHALASDSKNHILHGRICNSIAMMLIIFGRYGDALEYLLSGLEHAHASDDPEMLGYLNFNLGEIFRQTPGMAGEGIPYLLEARQLCQNDPHPHCSAILMSLAKCYHQTGAHDKAFHYAGLALKFSESSDDLINKGSCYEILADLYQEHGDFDKSHHFCDLSFTIREVRNEKHSLAALHLIKSKLFCQEGRYDKSIEHAKTALELIQETDAHSQYGDIQLSLAKAYEAKGQEIEAGRAYKAYVEHITVRHPRDLENKLSLMSSQLKVMQAEKNAEIHRLRHVELKEKSEQLDIIHDIGKKITSSLNLEEIIETLYHHLKGVMPLDSFTFAEYHQGQQKLVFDVVFDFDERMPPVIVEMDNTASIGVSCINQKCAIHIKDTWGDGEPLTVTSDGSPNIRSLVYLPLIMDNIILGVISVQSTLPDSYSDEQVEWLHQVSMYVAIAVNNAKKSELLTSTAISLENTLNALQTAQERLIRTEKLAALGELVAGVAHEINTPLGIGITLTSYLTEKFDRFRSKTENATLTKSDCTSLMNTLEEVIPTLQNNLDRVATIVNRFKALAMNPAFMVLNSFDVQQTIQESLWNFQLTAKGFRHHVEILCESPIEMDGYPGALSEVIGQLLDNSHHHAFDAGVVGDIRIGVHKSEGNVTIRFEDNGRGIPEDLISTIYNPFVTSMQNKGHIGLGLHLAHNLVTQVLRGTIELDRSYKPGTAFIITLKSSK